MKYNFVFKKMIFKHMTIYFTATNLAMYKNFFYISNIIYYIILFSITYRDLISRVRGNL